MGKKFRQSRATRVTTVSVVTAGLVVFTLAASAASLGGINVGSLFTQETPVTIEIPDPPGPIVFTDFSGCVNRIDGWEDASGAIWISHSGGWQCLGNNGVRAQQRVPLGNATVVIPYSTGIRVSTDIFDISHQSNRSGPGLSLLNDGSGNFVYVIYERDQDRVTIGVGSGGVDTPLFQITPAFSDLDSGTMSVELNGTVLDLTFGGQDFGPYDLVEATPLLGNTRFGLVADHDNFSTFNSFTIELLP